MKSVLSRPTRADVAREAGVTDTIVSYVVNANRYVDRDKKQRVQEAIKKLGYRPNTMARALKGKTTNHILFVVDDIQSEHFGSIIKEVNRLSYDKGYFFSLCYDKGGDDFVRRISDGFFDGVVIGSGRFSSKRIQELIDLNIPVILFEIRDYGQLNGSYAKINTGLFNGAKQCVKALYEKGRTNIVYIGESLTNQENGDFDLQDFRFRGFENQIKEFNLDVDDVRYVVGYRDKTDLSKCIHELINRSDAPNAFICRTDYVACTVIEILENIGLNVPNDVSVIGFNNSALCDFSRPRLSSVKIDRKTAGIKVLEFLEELMSEKDKQLEVVLETELVLREST